jgi:hypothetical protein
MVNGIFLLPLNWEIFAGPIWSTSGYCRLATAPPQHQPIELTAIRELARLSLY